MVNKKSAKRPPQLNTTAPKPSLGAEILLKSAAQNAVAMDAWGTWAGKADLAELVVGLSKQSDSVKAGDMTSVEAMLYEQSVVLQTIFTSLARRAALNSGEYLDAADKYMRLALKAQSQCRATLETLAIIKNPQPYIKQANISQGPQQVNNSFGKAPKDGSTSSRENFQNAPIKLMEHQLGNYLDAGTQGQASGANPHLATVEQVHRAKDSGRQGLGG